MEAPTIKEHVERMKEFLKAPAYVIWSECPYKDKLTYFHRRHSSLTKAMDLLRDIFCPVCLSFVGLDAKAIKVKNSFIYRCPCTILKGDEAIRITKKKIKEFKDGEANN